MPTLISIIALLISAVSLYYSRESELRQLEQLIVSGSEDLALSETSESFEVSKSFLVTNTSDRMIALQRLQLDLERAGGRPYSNHSKVELSGVDISHMDELNLSIKPGETVSLKVIFTPTMGVRAAGFLRNQTTGTNYEKLAALCKSLGIDFYDNPLSAVQKRLCPSFRNYKGLYNLQFRFDSGNGDLFMLVAKTYRNNRFSSDRYKLEIANSQM